jgi:hypothetical protein
MDDAPRPNHLHFDNGHQRFSSDFGHYHNATVINADNRPGHTPYVKVWFTAGLSAGLTRSDAVALAGELQRCLAQWPEPRTPGQP